MSEETEELLQPMFAKDFKKAFLINPHPESGAPGLIVAFSDDDRCALCVKGEKKGFWISPEAALQLASVIRREVWSQPTFSLAAWSAEEVTP